MSHFSNSTPSLGERTPLLASPQGGVAASLIKWCEATEKDAAGVVFLSDHSIRKTTPASRSAEARGIFLIARPPLLAVMQGGEFARLRFPAHSVFLKPFGILAEIRISDLEQTTQSAHVKGTDPFS